MKIVILGAPGSGKGTQASKIAEKYNLPHISTGDIFRENIKKGTPLGLQIQSIMEFGHFCPNELTVELVKDRVNQPDCVNGYLLDGFPRNLIQADALDTFSTPDIVVNLVVDLSKIQRRITGRRSCQACKGSFHTDFIGDTKVCPTCGGELITRKDDTSETVNERLSVYKSQTEPLIDFYKKQGKLVDIDGDKSIDEVFGDIVKVLG